MKHRQLTNHLPTDDPFRWCVHCTADCYEDDPEHSADCPMVTGVFPYYDSEYHYGMRCPGCGHVYTDGEVYVNRLIESGLASIYEGGICLGCAAQSQDLYEQVGPDA